MNDIQEDLTIPEKVGLLNECLQFIKSKLEKDPTVKYIAVGFV